MFRNLNELAQSVFFSHGMTHNLPKHNHIPSLGLLPANFTMIEKIHTDGRENNTAPSLLPPFVSSKQNIKSVFFFFLFPNHGRRRVSLLFISVCWHNDEVHCTILLLLVLLLSCCIGGGILKTGRTEKRSGTRKIFKDPLTYLCLLVFGKEYRGRP